MNSNLVAAIYFHPEAYPPTLNAVTELSTIFDKIEIIHRPHLKGSWIYPDNVRAIASGNFMTAREQERSSLPKKILFFKKFTQDLLKSCRQKKPDFILLYDSMALFSYWLIRPLLFFRHKAWYHNHDVVREKDVRKFSLSWFACKAESAFFKKLDVFTLPTDDRLAYFKMNEFRGKYFCIPNYPSLKFYSQFYKPKILNKELRIIFQGRIDKGHGLEEFIPLLKEHLNGLELKLILKGYIDDEYRKEIERLSTLLGVENAVEFYGFSTYIEVPKISSCCHIGIGIFAKKDLMNLTLGTASNKVYEYAAVGLPVLYLEDSNFKKHLEQFCWAFPVGLSTSSIKTKIEEIIAGYERYSNAAYDSFCRNLNFEYHFAAVKNYIQSVLKAA